MTSYPPVSMGSVSTTFKTCLGQASTQACFPVTPPVLLKKGVSVHISHFVAFFALGFQMVRRGVCGHILMQVWQPMHFFESIILMLPFSALT